MDALNVGYPNREKIKRKYVYPIIRSFAPKVMDKESDAIPKSDRLIEKVDQLRKD